jgi:hypothetical protein
MNDSATTSIERSYGLRYVVKKLFVICLGLVATLFFIQTAKLATVGRMGADISKLEVNESQIKLENEILRSQISELRSSQKVKSAIQDDESLGIVDVNIIPSIKDVEASKDVIASK